MRDKIFALLIHDNPDSLLGLKWALRELEVETFSVRNCQEAEGLLPQTQPQVVFVDTSLTEGSWVDAINLAERTDVPPNVIVVGANTNIDLYLSAMEHGAFDFVAPPFELEPLEYVVQSAALDARARKHAQARAAVV